MTPEGFKQAAPQFAERLLGETTHPLVEPSVSEQGHQVAVYAGRSLIDNAGTYIVMFGEPDDNRKTIRPDMVSVVPIGDLSRVHHPGYTKAGGREGWFITADTCTVMIPSDRDAQEVGPRVRVHHGTTAKQVAKSGLQKQVMTLTPITAAESTVQSRNDGGDVPHSA